MVQLQWLHSFRMGNRIQKWTIGWTQTEPLGHTLGWKLSKKGTLLGSYSLQIHKIIFSLLRGEMPMRSFVFCSASQFMKQVFFGNTIHIYISVHIYIYIYVTVQSAALPQTPFFPRPREWQNPKLEGGQSCEHSLQAVCQLPADPHRIKGIFISPFPRITVNPKSKLKEKFGIMAMPESGYLVSANEKNEPD